MPAASPGSMSTALPFVDVSSSAIETFTCPPSLISPAFAAAEAPSEALALAAASGDIVLALEEPPDTDSVRLLDARPVEVGRIGE
jgi:hypothetical protein